MRGYLNRPDADQEISWHDADGRRFLKTGDIGRIDQDGFVHVLDRARDMIVSGGINVFAADLEDVINRHDAVLEAAVIAKPDAEWGETPLAVVILRPGATADAGALKDRANGQLGKYQRISAVEISAEPLPRNHLEKVMKKALRDRFFPRDQA